MEFLADFLLELILLAVLGAVISTLYRFRSALTDWVVEQETMKPVSLAIQALGSLRDWLRKQKTRNPSRFWTLTALACWTVFVGAVPWVVTLVATLDAYRSGYALTSYGMGEIWGWSVICFCPGQAVLTLPAWAAVALAALAGVRRSGTSESHRDST